MNLVQRTWRDGKLLDILRLLYFRHDAVASDSRDKIFSLLGLTRDTFSVTEIRYYPPLHGPRYSAILLCCSMVILGGAFSTHLLGKGEEQKAQGRGDSKAKWVEYERKV